MLPNTPPVNTLNWQDILWLIAILMMVTLWLYVWPNRTPLAEETMTSNSDQGVRAQPIEVSTNHIPFATGLAQEAYPEERFLATLNLNSKIAYVVDQVTGRPLLDKNSHDVVPIASITKLMTAMVVLDANQPLEDVLRLSKADRDTIKYTKSRLPLNTKLTRSQAILLALLASENNAAALLARYYPGGTEKLVAAMNKKAERLGLDNSYFFEPTGLSPQNQANAQDLVKLIAAALKYPLIKSASTTAWANIKTPKGFLQYANTNALLSESNWLINLSKTGFINEAGRCLVMQTSSHDRKLLIVLLGSANTNSRRQDIERLHRWLKQI